MGVDLATYRAKIGTFRYSIGVDVVTIVVCVNISGCLKTIGSVVFIGVLLLIAGIESNPGPKIIEDPVDENQLIQQILENESVRAKKSTAPRSFSAMHTVLIVDTSGSMAGEPLVQAKDFISQFIKGLEEVRSKHGFNENLALVIAGREIQVAQHFTNDYSLILNATDAMTAGGPSPIHIGLMVPLALLSQGKLDDKVGVFQIGRHLIPPRIIFLSDGYISRSNDEPGQIPQRFDPEFMDLQSQCLKVSRTVVKNTLSKVYPVPLGNADRRFLESLACISRVKLTKLSESRFMSRHQMHHYLVSSLQENEQLEVTREKLGDLLGGICSDIESDDIDGVMEILQQGEPDIAGRDQQFVEQLFQANLANITVQQGKPSNMFTVGLGDRGFALSVMVTRGDKDETVHEQVIVSGMEAPKATNAMHTLIIVDTSANMEGEPIERAKQFISQFVTGLEGLTMINEYSENVALATVGKEIKVIQSFTNKYSLIRSAVDTLNTEGHSNMLIGMLLPGALLVNRKQSYQGGFFWLENHFVPPRVIVISNANLGSYMKGTEKQFVGTEQTFNPVLIAPYIKFIKNMVKDTLCKIYPVVVEESNKDFLEILSKISGGRIMTLSDAVYMSRNSLHHFVASKIKEPGAEQARPEKIAKQARGICDSIDERDINAIFEVIKQGEPDGDDVLKASEKARGSGEGATELSLGEEVGLLNDIETCLSRAVLIASFDKSTRASSALHTVFIVDTSGSMEGEPISEAKSFISDFIKGLEQVCRQLNLQENVAVISVGKEVELVQSFTNDYSSIQKALDRLVPAGPSKFHLGVMLLEVLLSKGKFDMQHIKGGSYRVGSQLIPPRVIFISDGYASYENDVPGQKADQYNEQNLMIQSLCISQSTIISEETLCKIYAVPVGSTYLAFLEAISIYSGGKIVDPSEARQMSKLLLYNFVANKLKEGGHINPTTEEVADCLRQITHECEKTDVDGVLEVLGQKDLDVDERDRRFIRKFNEASTLLQRISKPHRDLRQHDRSLSLTINSSEEEFEFVLHKGPSQQVVARENVVVNVNFASRTIPAVHTVLIVDTSGSMEGQPLSQAKSFIKDFVKGLIELKSECELKENVALITVGTRIDVLQDFTDDYSRICKLADTLCAKGQSKLHWGLLTTLALLRHHDVYKKAGVYHMHRYQVIPRVIFISDGYLSDKVDKPMEPQVECYELQRLCLGLLKKAVGDLRFEIYSVPVGNADEEFLRKVSELSGGKLMTISDCRKMSRRFLHHLVLNKEPSQDLVKSHLKEITQSSPSKEDIEGVYEALGHGNPDNVNEEEHKEEELTTETETNDEERRVMKEMPQTNILANRTAKPNVDMSTAPFNESMTINYIVPQLYVHFSKRSADHQTGQHQLIDSIMEMDHTKLDLTNTAKYYFEKRKENKAISLGEASDWDIYIDCICKNELSAKKLLDSEVLPNENQLNKLHQLFFENKSAKIAGVLESIEMLINKWIRRKHNNVKHVWLAYPVKTRSKVILVIETETEIENTVFDGIGYDYILRNFNQFSREAEEVIKSTDNGPLSNNNLIHIRKCINKHGKKLMNSHKHLSIINPSSVRSKGFDSNEHKIIKEACVALYVQRKGYIPICEEPFQSDYDGVKVDVREGAFYANMQREGEDTLTIGCSIAVRHDGHSSRGSLGGFIEHPQYGLCGLTCAHVVLEENELIELQHKGEISWPNFSTTSFVYFQTTSNINIGKLVKAVYAEGGEGRYGMEAALFQIEECHPESGAFWNSENEADVPLRSYNGKAYGPSRFPVDSKCFKVGATTGRTYGYSVSTQSDALTYVRTQALPTSLFKLYNQFEIRGEMRNNRICIFSDSGDSGSLVVLQRENACIGIVEGSTSFHTTIVTPIAPILERMNVTGLKSFETDNLRDHVLKLDEKIERVDNATQSIDNKVELILQHITSTKK